MHPLFRIRIALAGNPNSGKSSVFNLLTGLRQKVGNFPGVTVDKKTGTVRLNECTTAEIIDLPGTYSLYPKSPDERVVAETLLGGSDKRPDAVAVVVDASNLRRGLLLFSQVHDLGLSCILVLTMCDRAEREGLVPDIEALEKKLSVPVVAVNGRTGAGLHRLKKLLSAVNEQPVGVPLLDVRHYLPEALNVESSAITAKKDYKDLLRLHGLGGKKGSAPSEGNNFDIFKEKTFQSAEFQAKETAERYRIADEICEIAFKKAAVPRKYSDRAVRNIDALLLHPIWGYVFFMLILLLIFQAVFAWAKYPMDFIDGSIAGLSSFLHTKLPDGPLNDLLTGGILPGLGGVLVFIPQIAILFAFIAILEETGYMARVVFLSDRIMRRFGLNGRSIVPLFSGVACAIPAVMAARTIEHRKERLITIMVTPLMSCSARIPVYTVLIALVVPNKSIGLFNLQGLALAGMYLLGVAAALTAAFILKKILRTKDKSWLIMELPAYRGPKWRNVFLTVWEKVIVFVRDAGKIIVAISVILWVAASYGPPGAMKAAEQSVAADYTLQNTEERENALAAAKLKASYAGAFGKFLEPAIAPLGFEWRTGIALITSFAAREVFVGTMGMLYSVGSEAKEEKVTEKMRKAVNPDTQKPVHGPASAFSLLIFYAFAMQCMSTLAVVRRETKSWKWPLIQFLYMTGLAYAASFIAYRLGLFFF